MFFIWIWNSGLDSRNNYSPFYWELFLFWFLLFLFLFFCFIQFRHFMVYQQAQLNRRLWKETSRLVKFFLCWALCLLYWFVLGSPWKFLGQCKLSSRPLWTTGGKIHEKCTSRPKQKRLFFHRFTFQKLEMTPKLVNWNCNRWHAEGMRLRRKISYFIFFLDFC